MESLQNHLNSAWNDARCLSRQNTIAVDVNDYKECKNLLRLEFNINSEEAEKIKKEIEEASIQLAAKIQKYESIIFSTTMNNEEEATS